VVTGDGRLQRFRRGCRQANLFGDVSGHSSRGQGEVVSSPGQDQSGVVQQRGREQQLGVHVDLVELAQRPTECVCPEAVVEQHFWQHACGGVARCAGQDRVRGRQPGGSYVCAPAGVEVDDQAEPADGVADVHTGHVGDQAPPLRRLEAATGAVRPVDGSNGRCRVHSGPSSRRVSTTVPHKAPDPPRSSGRDATGRAVASAAGA